ncbi:hypothetical protein BV22DRAFT_1052710 [Leucogyrophana mollusca]|uniref:Uncharacterized protein n=1 Tax=Leucogyrophana mollusca TaxID=85980 RepID=A0ACB8AUH7_9AGAM|nr:hypothetical protein BV22DRAFT_1052710 [Leucogyrophana mollusca]
MLGIIHTRHRLDGVRGGCPGKSPIEDTGVVSGDAGVGGGTVASGVWDTLETGREGTLVYDPPCPFYPSAQHCFSSVLAAPPPDPRSASHEHSWAASLDGLLKVFVAALSKTGGGGGGGGNGAGPSTGHLMLLYMHEVSGQYSKVVGCRQEAEELSRCRSVGLDWTRLVHALETRGWATMAAPIGGLAMRSFEVAMLALD